MPRQFIRCAFREGDSRSYTYHLDSDQPAQIGDRMRVPDKDGDGWRKVWIVGLADVAPPFPTKGAQFHPLTDEEKAQLKDQPANETPKGVPF
jgi:hypothetical protein